MVELDFRILDEEAGERIDKVVARRLPELGRRRAAELFGRGWVLVDGRVAKKGERAGRGSAVVVRFDREDIDAQPELPLSVVHEAPLVAVVTKPAGQPSAPIRVGETGTLANAILGRYPETRGIGHRPREPGLLHRLDTQTSGLLVVARSSIAFERLWRALSEGRIEKRYLAVVRATNAESAGVIDQCLAPDSRDPRRVAVVPASHPGARRATTRVRTVRTGRGCALIELDVAHAYRHQVRAHLSWAGAPILGDALYGGDPVGALGERHALHASYVAWAGDEVVPAFTVEDPLPDELAALLFD